MRLISLLLSFGSTSVVEVIGSPVGSGSYFGLARSAARTFPRDDDAGDEQLSAPDAPRLLPFMSAGQAWQTDRTLMAQRLGEFDVSRRLGEPQLRVAPARDRRLGLDHVVEDARQQHGSHLPSCLGSGNGRRHKTAADPDLGSAAWKASV
jgi:hypothetical protein